MLPSRWIVLVASTLPFLAACGSLAGRVPSATTSDATSPEGAELVAQHLEALDRLGSASPAEQAAMTEAARIDFVAVPTAGNRLRYALVLGTAGHAGFDAAGARQLLQALLDEPGGLSGQERTLASIMDRRLENLLSLQARLRQQESSDAAIREQLAAARQRTQSLASDNDRLREELELATRKLEAIAELEKTLSIRRIAPEDKP